MADAVQRLEIRKAEVGAELSTLVGKDDLDEAGETRMRELTAEVGRLEERWLAAKAAATAAPAVAGPVSNRLPKDKEWDTLANRVSLAGFLSAGMEQRSHTGAEAEYAAQRIPGTSEPGAVPLEMLLTDSERLASFSGPEMRSVPEQRATTTTWTTGTGPGDQSPTMWRNIAERVFAAKVTDMFGPGFLMETIPSGQVTYPYVSSGASPTQVAEGAAITSSDLGVTLDTLSPRRLGHRMDYSVELSAQLAQVESTIRRELMAAFSDSMEQSLLTYASAETADGPNCLFSGITRAAIPSATSTFQEIASLAYGGVEGIWAVSEGDIRLFMPPVAYSFAGSVYETTSTTENALYMLKMNSGGVYASAHLAAAGGSGRTTTSDVWGIRNRPGAIFGVMPVWDAFFAERDPYTRGDQGEVVIRATVLWNARRTRDDAIYSTNIRRS